MTFVKTTVLTLVGIVVAKERAKAEKTQKFLAKQASRKETTSGAPKAEKKKAKEKEEALPQYVEKTPAGQKKSQCRPSNLAAGTRKLTSRL